MATLTPLPCNKLELFVLSYLSQHLKLPVPQVHRGLYAVMDDQTIKRLAIEFFRGGGKTTLTRFYLLYRICESDEEEIQYIAQTGDSDSGLAPQMARKIRAEIENNKLLIHDYGLSRGAKWTDGLLTVNRIGKPPISLYFLGKGGAVRGKRGEVIIDDPQDEDDCRSEAVLDRDHNWLHSDVLPVLQPQQRLTFIGTSISPLALCAEVQRLPGWTTYKFQLETTVGSGISVFPALYPDSWIEFRKAESGIDMFNAQYNCMPRVSGNPVFKPEWMLGYDPESVAFQRELERGLYTVTGMDCAESKADSADYTAIITPAAGYEPKSLIYVCEVKRGHWTTKEGAEQLLLTYDKYQQHKSIVESRVTSDRGGDAMIQEIRERERIYGKYCNLYPVKPDKDKVRRAHFVQSLFQEGRVRFDLTDKNHQILINELTMFTGQQTYHDDCVDALVYALTEIKQRQQSSARRDKDESTEVLPEYRSPHTGASY